MAFEVAIMIGLPGSGKTTFCRERLFPGHIHVSLDVLRTRSAEAELFAFALRRRKRCVIDDTNVNARERARFIPAAKEAGAQVIGYFFEPDLAVCVARNAARQGKARVPEVAIRGKLAKFETPRLGEGFDHLYRVTIIGDDFQVEAFNAEE